MLTRPQVRAHGFQARSQAVSLYSLSRQTSDPSTSLPRGFGPVPVPKPRLARWFAERSSLGTEIVDSLTPFPAPILTIGNGYLLDKLFCLLRFGRPSFACPQALD